MFDIVRTYVTTAAAAAAAAPAAAPRTKYAELAPRAPHEKKNRVFLSLRRSWTVSDVFESFRAFLDVFRRFWMFLSVFRRYVSKHFV